LTEEVSEMIYQLWKDNYPNWYIA